MFTRLKKQYIICCNLFRKEDFVNQLMILAILLFTALFFRQVFLKIKLPTVLGYMIAGIFLGPSILNIIHGSHLISSMAELGVIVLMFIAGLECDLQLLKKYFKPSITIAFLGIILPVIGMYWIGQIMALSKIESLFVGIIFAATSVSISVAVLKELNKLKTQAGTTILGAAVADDILSILLLSIVISFAGIGDSDHQVNLYYLIASQIGFFLLICLLSFIIKKIPLDGLEKLKSIFPILSLAFLLLLSGIAELVQVSAITGAFFAGIIVSQTKYKDNLTNQIDQFGQLFFIPLFFINVGLSVKLDGIFDNSGLFILILIIAVLTKFIGAYSGARLFKFSRNNASQIGIGMISRGEVGLIIAEIGLKNQLISTEYYSTIIAVIIITTIITPILLRMVIKAK